LYDIAKFTEYAKSVPFMISFFRCNFPQSPPEGFDLSKITAGNGKNQKALRTT
jgi:hypothetical protein